MIKIEHIVGPSDGQLNFVVEGMRNPMNSWDKSDSFFGSDCYEIEIGDMKLMRDLYKAGTDHRKYLRMLNIYARITAPLYWWKEFDTYKIGTVANSCSTMHKITANKFELTDFSYDKLYPVTMVTEEELFREICVSENGSINVVTNSPTGILQRTVNALNFYRDLYLKETDPDKKKEYWWQIIQLLPSSYNQTRNVMISYEALINMIGARKNHKLDEWREFCYIMYSRTPWLKDITEGDFEAKKGITLTKKDLDDLEFVDIRDLGPLKRAVNSMFGSGVVHSRDYDNGEAERKITEILEKSTENLGKSTDENNKEE